MTILPRTMQTSIVPNNGRVLKYLRIHKNYGQWHSAVAYYRKIIDLNAHFRGFIHFQQTKEWIATAQALTSYYHNTWQNMSYFQRIKKTGVLGNKKQEKTESRTDCVTVYCSKTSAIFLPPGLLSNQLCHQNPPWAYNSLHFSNP